ncbi:SOS response-associated peptidase [Rhodococcus marinonascens]|uniref:SOS response-associated peptidase n=1 Tax=Rhodococcus marinonascens TaxID=38311 RepID=UPI000935048D|nr:SOS response-associated peptidase [Rhodococcus marinonascens]
MCGRYATTANPATLAADLGAINEAGLGAINEAGEEPSPPDFNVVPTTAVLTVVDRHGARRIRRMRWGLVPPWTKEIGKGPVLFNARADSVDIKPAFRNAFQHKRCLVPMDGWYEWQTEMAPDGAGAGTKKSSKVRKIPYYMSTEDGSRMYMAGLWSVWHDRSVEESPPVLSCSIITVDSAPHLEEVHDRMPLVMPQSRWAAWLDPEHPVSTDLLAVSPDEVARITVRRVSTLVNSVRNNGPHLLDPGSEGWGESQVGEQISLL